MMSAVRLSRSFGLAMVVVLFYRMADAEAQDRSRVDFSAQRGAVIESADQRSRLELHFASWMRLEGTSTPGSESVQTAFTVPLARPLVQAFFAENRVEIFFMPELAGADPALLDMYAQWNLSDRMQLRFGQFRTPYSRAFMTPIVELQLDGRGTLSDEFRLDRDTGLMAQGRLGAIEYYAGVFSGASVNRYEGLDELPMGVARLVYNIGDLVPYVQVPGVTGTRDFGLALGVNAAWQQRILEPELGSAGREESLHLGADVALMIGGVFATAEGYVRTRERGAADPQDDYGGFVQAGTFVVHRLVDVAARAGFTRLAGAGDLRIYEGSVSYYARLGSEYFGQRLKLTGRYAVDDSEDPYGPGLASGLRHRLLLQAQAWF